MNLDKKKETLNERSKCITASNIYTDATTATIFKWPHSEHRMGSFQSEMTTNSGRITLYVLYSDMIQQQKYQRLRKWSSYVPGDWNNVRLFPALT